MEKLVTECFDRAKSLLDNADERLANAAYLYIDYCSIKNYPPATQFLNDQKLLVRNNFSGSCGLLLEAQGGNPVAQFLVGMMYYTGDKVETDYQEGVSWFRRSAEQGFSDAEFSLGCAYYFGKSELQNYTSAVKWFLKSAVKGNVNALYNMGVCCQSGLGIKTNIYKAIKYYRRAAALGHDKAESAVARLYYQSNRPGQFAGFLIMLLSVFVVIATQLFTADYRGADNAPDTLGVVVLLSMLSSLFGLFFGRRLYAGKKGRSNLIMGLSLLISSVALTICSFSFALTLTYAITAALYAAFCIILFIKLIKEKRIS